MLQSMGSQRAGHDWVTEQEEQYMDVRHQQKNKPEETAQELVGQGFVFFFLFLGDA